MKKIFNCLSNILVLICVLIILISFFSLYQSTKDPDRILTIFGYRPAIVTSGSMKPTINPGDMVISKVVSAENLQAGDVITYRVDGTIPNTHRITEVITQGGQLMFKTKGDASEAEDGGEISADRLVGKMVYKIPQVGFAVEFLKSKFGFTVVIIIPLVLLFIITLLLYFLDLSKRKHKKQINDG